MTAEIKKVKALQLKRVIQDCTSQALDDLLIAKQDADIPAVACFMLDEMSMLWNKLKIDDHFDSKLLMLYTCKVKEENSLVVSMLIFFFIVQPFICNYRTQRNLRIHLPLVSVLSFSQPDSLLDYMRSCGKDRKVPKVSERLWSPVSAHLPS